jgi:hypothetical protein
VAHLNTYDLILQLSPHILPPEPELNEFTLGFPDLHPGNILVQGDQPMQVTAFLDWQGTCVRPRIENFTVPHVFSIRDGSLKFVSFDLANGKIKRPSNNPDFLAALTDEDRERVRIEETRVVALMLYVDLINNSLKEKGLSPSLSSVIDPSERIRSIQALLWRTARSWEEGLPNLYRAVFEATEVFCRIKGLESTPVTIPMDMVEAHDEDYESFQQPAVIQQAIERRLTVDCSIPIFIEGEVQEENYDRACEELEKVRLEFLEKCGSEEAKVEFMKLWPFQDGKWSTTAELCR